MSSLSAITLPVSEDTSTSANKAQKKLLTPPSGIGSSLGVSASQTAFVRFDAGSMADTIPATEVSRALLTIYFPTVTKAGDITLHPVTEEWTESVPGNVVQPAFAGTAIATVPAASVVHKQYVMVDVTAQVRTWLATPSTDFGFALASSGATKVQIGSKEGAALGHPAVLEIERKPVVENEQIAPGIDAGKLGDGSVSNTELSYLNGVTSLLQPQIQEIRTDLNDANSLLTELQTGLGNTNTLVTGIQTELTNTGTLLAGKVNKAGDTMTGALILPANGLTVGTNQLAVAEGKVGIGTATPTAALEVRGDVKLGANGQLSALGAEENLRIVRGTIEFKDGTLTIVNGSGFTVMGPLSLTGGEFLNDLTVTFATPFSGPPTVTFSKELVTATGSNILSSRNVTEAGFGVGGGAFLSSSRVHFLAVGPR